MLMHGCTAYHRFTRQGGTLGSQQCDWQLLDQAQRIHPLHCEIRWREEGFCVIDHSGETYLNGNDLSLPPGTHVRLKNEDQLQIGDYVIIAYIGEPNGPTGKRHLGEHSLTELMNGDQCPLQDLVRPLPERAAQFTDASDLDPLIALEAATQRSQGTWLFGDLFTPSKGSK
ncbi:FHA domain-containing protein [Pseudomonas sp. MAFF 301350]|uniref:FHA domain-containing protein n=2 Tax=Pseudomonas aegrilactucae TaxID=2854028 RepID=A0A9Q3ACK7_9PSED|nr:FHA domain-containing protein [Pseudomonas aegrilactucae]